MSPAKNILVVAGSVALLFVTAGCYTTLNVNCGNGTAGNIRVKSAYTGQEIEIPPNRFKKLPHSSGDLVVTTQNSDKFKFPDVAPFQVADKYLSKRSNIFGPGSVTLTLRLETNMQLYVLMPGKLTVDQNVEQPKGYPKAGEKLNQ